MSRDIGGLVLQDLAAGYPGGGQVLHGIALAAPLGQAVSLVGRNGMGKTTTVRALMGLLPLLGGTVRLGTRDLTGARPAVVARAGIGLVPEGRRVFASLTVEENLIATARPGAWSLPRVYTLFPQLQDRRRNPARTLSGGEQQMLAVGRAVLTNPRLLVLDEATEGLAPLIRQEIWTALGLLKREGLGVLVIDKNLAEMAALVDRHHVIEKGRIVWAGTPAQLAAEPGVAERYLGVA